eukprot:916560-Prorocentrum_minimum.AAC.1
MLLRILYGQRVSVSTPTCWCAAPNRFARARHGCYTLIYLRLLLPLQAGLPTDTPPRCVTVCRRCTTPAPSTGWVPH